jgi:putative peptide zinc metalloprotease protein
MTPTLRHDLICRDAGRDATGAKLTLIFDPLKNSYYRISEAALALLQRGEAAKEEDHSAFLKELNRQGLLSGDGFRDEALRQEIQRRQHRWQRALHGYLFFRVPLLRPGALLDGIIRQAGFLFHPAFWCAVGLIWLCALLLILRQPDTFLREAGQLLSMGGIAYLGTALLILKLVHELGHGLVARRHGARVPSMGLAFMLLAPLFYTDTTDIWRLPRRQRMHVALAGVIAESVIAGAMLLLWTVLDPGPMRALALAMAITGLSTSLLVNLNPLMRFDGYFILSDLTGIDNLQQRGFAIGRWHLRETLFNLLEPAPEAMPKRQRLALAFFAYATWLYRLGLFLGIALAVYAFFIKAVGIILFLIEIAVFIAMPLWREGRIWWNRRATIIRRKRSAFSLALLAAILLLLVLPLDRHVEAPARLSGADVTALFPGAAGQITAIHAKAGDRLKAGDPVLTLAQPDLEHAITKARLQLGAIALRRKRLAASARDRALTRITEEEYQAAREQLAALLREQEKSTLRAPFDGVLIERERDLGTGQAVAITTRIGRIMRENGSELRGYIAEADRTRLKPNSVALFIPDDLQMATAEARLIAIAPGTEKRLTLPELADRQGGTIRSTGRPDQPEAADSIFSIRLTTAAAPPRQAMIGIVRIEAEPQSFAAFAFRRIARVLLRESQF